MIMLDETSLTDDQQHLILSHIESIAGGKLRLSDEDRIAVYRLLAESQEARDFAEEARLDEAYIANAFDFEVDQSGNEKLAAWILSEVGADVVMSKAQGDGSAASEDAGAESKIIEFLRPNSPIRNPWVLAAAASIALLFTNLGWSHFYFDQAAETVHLALQLEAVTDNVDRNREAMRVAQAEADKWADAAYAARNDGDDAALKLAEARLAISTLQVEQATLQSDLAMLIDESAGSLSQDEIDELNRERQHMIARVEDLDREVADKQQQLAGLAEGQDATARNHALQLASLQAELDASRSWIGQVVSYHPVYASQPKEFLVERAADEKETITRWLSGQIGREIKVPDLSELGVTFFGARLLTANGKPIAQLVYLDPEDRPVALCIMPFRKGPKDPTAKETNGLNLVDWRSADHGYLVIGEAGPDLIGQVAEKVRPYYEL